MKMVKDWLRRKVATQTTTANEFWENTMTPIAVIVQDEKPVTDYTNKYELYDAMVDVDPDLAGTLDDLTALVVTYYNGVYLDVGEDRKTSEEEKNVIERLETLEEDFDFREFIEAITNGVIKYGDMFLVKGGTVIRENGEARRVPKPLFLPRPYCSFAEKKDKTGWNEREFIQKPNWVAVNRFMIGGEASIVMNENVKFYRNGSFKNTKTGAILPSQIIHFTRLNQGILEKDQYKTLNMNCISKSPLKPLETIVKYKRHAIIMDMAWREGNVPFIHYKVDMSAYDPTRFPGATQELKIAAAEKSAKAKLEEFRDSIRKRARDQGLITPNTTIAEHVEPKTRNYASPNDQLNQINLSMSSRLGALQRVRTKEGGSYAADLLLSSITEPRLRIIAFKIFRKVELYIREFLSKEIADKKLLRRIKIRKNLILPHERLDRAREALFMTQAKGTFLREERREVLGRLPLTSQQKEQLKKEMELEREMNAPMFGNQESDKSPGDVVGDGKRGGGQADKVIKTPPSQRRSSK